MADLNILKLKFPTLDGNNAVLDLDDFQSNIDEDIAAITGRLDALESGSRQFALKDYSRPENQSEMIPMVYYYVPFDSEDAFIQLDEHGQPTGGKQIVYFDVYMKAGDGTVTKITRQYTDGNLEGIAYLNKKATFEAGIAKSQNAATWTELADTDVVTKGEVNLEIARIDTAITGITEGTTQIKVQDATNAQKGVVVLSDAVDGTQAAADGATAATPAAVKAVNDKAVSVETALNALTTKVGAQGENVAFLAKANVFTKDQTINGTVSSSSEVAKVIGKSANFDRTTGTLDNSLTDASVQVVLQDKNAAEVGSFGVKASATETVAQMSVSNKDASATGDIKVTFNVADGTFKATAPSTDSNAVANEIATADFVIAKTDAVEASIVDATDTQRGLVTLSDAIDGTENAATGKKAATPKAVADAKAAAITEASEAAATALKKVTDVIGVNAEHAALKNGDNVFTGENSFSSDGATLVVNGSGISGDEDTDLHIGAGSTEIVISASGSITRPAMKGGEGETEIPTKKYVDDLVNAHTIPDATTEVAGKVELATAGEITSGAASKVVDAAGLKTVTDAINLSISNIINGTTQIAVQDATEAQKGVVTLASTAEVVTGTDTAKAVTAAGVKAALDAKIQVVTDEGLATTPGVLYIIVENSDVGA